MKKILFFAVALFSTLTIVSCRQDEPEVTLPSDEPIEVQYSFSDSRSAPADGTTFGFISYTHNTTTGITVQDPLPSSGTFYGSYAYFAALPGIMTPCDVDASFDFTARNPAKGQALIAGDYKTFCVSPAIPVTPYKGSQRFRYTRNQELDAAKVPIDMEVTGYNVFDIPTLSGGTLELSDVRAKISIEIIKGGTSDFTINNPSLENAGTFGWYHPLLQISDISYNTDPSYIDTPLENSEPLSISTFPTTTGDLVYNPDGLGLPFTGTDPVVYRAENMFVFANKYVTGYAPVPIRLDFQLVMSGSPFNMQIPLGVDMESSTHYKFKIVVKSTIVILYYSVVDWETGYDNIDEIGGAGETLIASWNLSAWVDGYPGGSGPPDTIGN